MAVLKEQWIEWREEPLTALWLSDAANLAETTAAEMLTRRQSNPMDDQYLKGFIAGLSACVGWVPPLIKENPEDQDQDVIKEEENEV